MARRAQQGAVSRCPWCEASLPQVAVECPECQLPLTMAAAEGGLRTTERNGTSSTATPAGRAPVLAEPAGHFARPGSGTRGRRVHRMRIVAWLLGLSSILLLVAGMGAMASASSPGARSDREAKASLATALHRDTDDPGYRQDVVITDVAGDQPSDQASRVSSDQAEGFWFGAARSASGRCFLLAGRASDATLLGGGTLADDEPCSAARVRFHLERKLVEAERP